MNQLTVIVVKAELNKVYTHCGQNQLLKNMVKALVENEVNHMSSFFIESIDLSMIQPHLPIMSDINIDI